MAKTKRPREDDISSGLNGVHPSRQKRLKYGEQDVQLADIYNNLADEVQSTRINAARELLKKLSAKSSDQAQKLETSEARLIRGLCSGRKAARLGFSIALAEVFRLKTDREQGIQSIDVNLVATVDRIVELTTPKGNVSGQEKRDGYLGRRSAFQALLQSDIGLDQRLPDDQWRYVVQSLFSLGSVKPWLRRECCGMLYDYLISPNASNLSSPRIRILVDEMISSKLAKTAEGVAIWITVQQRFPHAKLPKDIWHHKHPLSSRELPLLSKILLEVPTDDDSLPNSGSRQSTPSFAWSVILSQLFEHESHDFFTKFWNAAVASTLFSSSSSSERRAFGFQVLSLAVLTAPAPVLPVVVGTQNILNCLLDQLSDAESYLFNAAKVPLNHIIARIEQERELAPVFIRIVIEAGTYNFDRFARSRIVDRLVREASLKGLEHMVPDISKAIRSPGALSPNHAANFRRMLADLFLVPLRAHRQSSELFLVESDKMQRPVLAFGVKLLLGSLVSFAYERQDTGVTPPLSEASRSMFRSRLMSCIGCLVENTLEKAVVATTHVMTSLSVISDLSEDLDEAKIDVVDQAIKIMNEATKGDSSPAIVHAFQLLLSLSVVQVYNGEADGVAALEDLMSCYHSWGNSDDSSMLLIELLLSFMSKPSAVFRKLVEQVFPLFAAEMTSDSLQSFVDILKQKESLDGQQVLFAQQGEDEDNDGEEPMSHDESIEDVEDESDVELVDGHPLHGLDKSGEDDGDESSESSPNDGESTSSVEKEDEEAAFDKKLAEALGTTDVRDSDDDGSDMDDEQMMALEPHLTSIFKERQKITSKKDERKDAKETVVNFKNRVLDLLKIYVKAQCSNVLALDLLLPLTDLIRTTTSKATSEKAFAVLKEYYEACTKNKVLPQPQETDECFSLLTAVHENLKLPGSNIYANACSRAGLFLSKVLINLDPGNYTSIASMYAQLQSEWYLDGKSNVRSSVFTEWTSWSISTKRQT